MNEQTASGTTGQAPGWDADPYGRHELRYWDGAAWTEHVSDRGVAGHDAPEQVSPWAAMATVAAAPPEPVAPAAPTPAPAAAPASAPAPAPAAPAPAPAAAPCATASAATAAPPATPAPTPSPARPAGPSWAWDQPVSMPAVGPTSSPTGTTAPVAGAPAVPTAPRKRTLLWVSVAAVAVVVIVAGAWFLRRPAGRIDAGPPAATPAGFRVVSAPDYRIAVPSPWVSRVITSQDRTRLGDQLDQASPGFGDAFDKANDQVDGTMIMVADPVTRDNVNVVPFHSMRGDPSDPDTIAEIRRGIDAQSTGATLSGMTTAPADVHGFPAVTLTYSIRVGAVSVSQVATVIQTGDHVFQVTVTARSPDRAAQLSGQIVPTFDPT